MTAARYEDWHDRAIREYADDKARAGNWPAEEALSRSQDEFSRLLPDGLATPDNWLFSIENAENGTAVGIIWLAALPEQGGAGRRAFIYDFEIDAAYRRRGYGTEALKALDEKAREMGFAEIGLHVFGHNLPARALYEKAGYEVTNVNMSRRLT